MTWTDPEDTTRSETRPSQEDGHWMSPLRCGTGAGQIGGDRNRWEVPGGGGGGGRGALAYFQFGGMEKFWTHAWWRRYNVVNVTNATELCTMLTTIEKLTLLLIFTV